MLKYTKYVTGTDKYELDRYTDINKYVTGYNLSTRHPHRIRCFPVTGAGMVLTEADIVENGLTIDRTLSSGNDLKIGSAVCAEMTLKLNKNSRDFSGVDFVGMKMIVYVKAPVGNYSSQTDQWSRYVDLGTFYVTDVETKKGCIILHALDGLSKADSVYPESRMTYMYFSELSDMLEEMSVCSKSVDLTYTDLPACQVSLSPKEFNKNNKGFTYRDFLSNVAVRSCACALITPGDRLEFIALDASPSGKHYDSDADVYRNHQNDAVFTLGESDIYEYSLCDYSISYTGSTIKTNKGEYAFGTTDRIMSITVDIVSSTVASEMNTQLMLLSYTPFSAKIRPMPWIELGDTVDITITNESGEQETTRSIITYIKYNMDRAMEIGAVGSNESVNVKTSSSSVKGTEVSGDLYTPGTITVSNHSSPIGTVVSNTGSGTVSAATATWTSVTGTNITLQEGTWIVNGQVKFASNASGRRMVRIATKATSASSWSANTNGHNTLPAGSGDIYVHSTCILNITADTDVCLQAYQNSGSALNVGGSGAACNLQAVRIA